MIERAFEESVNSQLVRLASFSALLERMFERTIGFHDGSVHLTLLFASALKIRQSARAVRLLSDAGCVEEILAICRTLLEVTVNAAYLQVGSAREVQRYLRYHPEAPRKYASVNHGAGNSLSRRSNRPPGRSLGLQLMRRISRLTLLRSSARTPEPTSGWSARTLMERAAISDEVSDIPVMVPLVQRCFTRGLAAVQGTIGSLDCFVSALSTMQPPELEGRLAELTEALFGINLCLLTWCTYLNSYFHLHMDLEIQGAAHDSSEDRGWA